MEILPAFTQAGDKKAAVKFNKRFKEKDKEEKERQEIWKRKRRKEEAW